MEPVPIADQAFLLALRGLSPAPAAALFLAENVLVLAVALMAGRWLIPAFAHRRVAPPPPLTGLEVAFAASTVLLNAAVTWAGWELWRRGLLTLQTNRLSSGASCDLCQAGDVVSAAPAAPR